MDSRRVVRMIVRQLGGQNNIQELARCKNRIRLVLKDEKECNMEKLNRIDCVKGSFIASGQLQLVMAEAYMELIYSALEQIVSERKRMDAGKVAIEEIVQNQGQLTNIKEMKKRRMTVLYEDGRVVLYGLFAGCVGAVSVSYLSERLRLFALVGSICVIVLLCLTDHRLKRKNAFVTSKSVQSEENGTSKNNETEFTEQVYSPMCGKVIPLKEVEDETFASGVLGKGVAILPEGEYVKAPFDGEVQLLYDSCHALALKGKTLHLLIHIGIDTAKLAGEYFHPLVKNGQSFKKGETLLQFDRQKILDAGKLIISPIIIINADEYEKVEITGRDTTDYERILMEVR